MSTLVFQLLCFGGREQSTRANAARPVGILASLPADVFAGAPDLSEPSGIIHT